MHIQLPDYGVFLHWPEEGEGWIHPDDVETANRLIPSTRVFRRERFDGTYYHLVYGDQTLRVRPVMWLSVEGEGIDVGEWVEVRGIGMSREPFVGEVLEARYRRRNNEIRYTVRRADMRQPQFYRVSELRPLKEHVSLRGSDYQIKRSPIDE